MSHQSVAREAQGYCRVESTTVDLFFHHVMIARAIGGVFLLDSVLPLRDATA